VIGVLAALAVAQEPLPQAAYVTAAPVPAVLGLATLNGRFAIRLEPGCESIVPGVNVLLVETPGDPWLQVVEPVHGVLPESCRVLHRQLMSDVPCGTNLDGACDVAFS
jgi:hypothetical protein